MLLVGINVVLMSLTAGSMSYGPFSSLAQLAWYRYGSLGFLVCGALLPAIGLKVFSRSRWAPTAIAVWALVVLFAFVSYVFLSGRGV